MADKILCIGTANEKLPLLLTKLGYSMLSPGDGQTISSLDTSDTVDLVIFEETGDLKFEEAIELLRSQPGTKHAAVIFISSSPEEVEAFSKSPSDNIEIMSSPYSLGVLAGRIATLLRLRKFKGLDESSSSLSEMNAALRDLNAHYQKELEEARQIQASLLPQQLPVDERYDVSVFYSPLEEVGGDWYNILIEDSGKISAQVADVSGHGLAAAFLGSMAKLGFSAVAEELPHKMFQGMNSLLTPQMPSGRFVTMCGFLFDPETGHVDFARAGHLPALILRSAEGKVDELKGEGFALGFFDSGEYSHEKTELSHGDAIAVFSDGLVEAQNRDSAGFGLEGISRSLVLASSVTTAEEICRKIIADFEAFLDGRVLKDDVTLLVLRRA